MSHNPKHRMALLGLSVLSLAMLAGCAGLDDSDTQTTGKNRTPEAVLNSSEATVDSGETISFDAKGSEDEDGRIESYRYSFGDGTTAEAADADSKVEHVYLHGGEYIVTLTVTDDGNDRAGALSDTATVEVVVNDRIAVAQQAIAAQPSPVDEMNQTFEVFEDADRFELDLDVTGNLVTGSSVVEVRIVDPDGDVLATETVTVDNTETDTVDLNGLLTEEGVHAIEVEAASGSATIAGELRVFYGAEDF